MLKRGGKRGLSTIVATLIIILLVLVAVGIIWIVIRNVIQQGSEQVSLGKFTLDLQIEQVQTINDSQLNVKIKRNAGAGEFVGLKFIAEDDNIAETISLNYSLEELEERIFSINLLRINASNVKKISIAPIFRLASGKEVTGDIKDEFEITVLSPSGGSICTDTCASLGYTCGTRTICGASVNCGTCASGFTCQTNGTCLATPCTDTCASLGYQCGTQTICGASVNCGNCTSGFTCQTNGTCIATPAVCGNNILEYGEQCDGSQLGGATCATVRGTGYTGTLICTSSCTFNTSACIPPVYATIFVTSIIYPNGNLGGLSGADSQCQTLADAAGLSGTWKAWISDVTNSATTRLNHLTTDYYLRNGVIVANGWSDLTDGNLENPIDVDENGNTVNISRVNTGTNATGFTFGGDSGRYCYNWYSSGGWTYAGYTNYYQDYRWTTQSAVSCSVAGCGSGGGNCLTPFRIYCLRQ